MNRGFDRGLCLFAGYCFTVAIAATCLIQMARGQDAVPPGPPLACQSGQCPIAEQPVSNVDPLATQLLHRASRALMAEFGNGFMFRVTMPHPGQFFEKACNGPTSCEEMLQRVGEPRVAEINVEIEGEFPHTKQAVVLGRISLRPGDVIDTREVRTAARRLIAAQFEQEREGEQQTAFFSSKFVRLGCPCAAAGECVCASHAACGSECAAEDDEAKCGDEGCELTNIVVRHASHPDESDEYHPLTLMRHIAGLVGEKAAAQAALAVRTEAAEQLGELYETMAELLADNAALDAKLEAQADQLKLVEKMGQLAAENARLKTHVELAAERAEVARSAVALTLENERLKLRLVELENKQVLAEAARTAAKPRERKAR